MPDSAGRPQAGDEVLFPDGTTGVIRAYEHMVLQATKVRMAQPCRQEYVLVDTFDPKLQFWLVAVPPRAVQRAPEEPSIPWVAIAVATVVLALATWWTCHAA
jgi:hypothetical protein